MITKRNVTAKRNSIVRRGRAMNKLAGLLLLGGSIFRSESMLKAAEKYFPGSPEEIEKEAIKCYEIFEKEVQNEIEERKNNPLYARQRYLMDLMLEDILGFSSPAEDSTIEYQKELKKFVTDIYKDAIDKSLEQFGWYNGLKEDVENRFGLEQEDSAFKIFKRKIERSNFLDARSIETGIEPSLSKDRLGVSAYATLKDFNLLGVGIDGGKLEVCPNKLKVCLEKAISDKIFSCFNFRVKDFEKAKTDVSFSLTGERDKSGRWIADVGYGNDGAHASIGLVYEF